MDIYGTGALVRVVDKLDIATPFLLDTFFGLELQSDDEKVYFDAKDGTRRIAPLISPLIEGKVVQEQGFHTDSFTPPYIKLKTPVLPGKQLKRRAGEAIGGSLTPDQRRILAIADALQDHEEMIRQREEVMASEVLRTGALSLTVEGYGTVSMDFGRDAALTVTLAGTDQWDDVANSTPVDDIEAWADLIQQKGGGVVRDVVMEPSAWQNARKNAQVTDLLDTRRGSTSTAETGPMAAEKARFVGTLGEFRVWVYQDRYVDAAGSTQLVLPAGTVVLAGPDALGTRAYGAIQDVRALRPMRRFVKQWEQQDPSAEFVMTQSSPLMVPFRPNGTLCATVL